jgi:hypothetical protein
VVLQIKSNPLLRILTKTQILQKKPDRIGIIQLQTTAFDPIIQKKEALDQRAYNKYFKKIYFYIINIASP